MLKSICRLRRKAEISAFCLLLSAFYFLLPGSLCGQVETVESAQPPHYTWVSGGRVEGHLALHYSPAGAFSPDSSTLAVVSEEKIVLLGVNDGSIRKVLKIHIPSLTELNIQSANFLAMNQLFLLFTGIVSVKGKGAGGSTPLLGLQWDTIEDRSASTMESIGRAGGFGPILFFPHLETLVLYKAGTFAFWDPRTHRGGQLTIPDLTQTPNVYAFSPDGHWALLAQISMSTTPDPVVVEAKQHRFVDSLRGHGGTVLGMAFSRDGTKVVTACEDGKVRIFSVPAWTLLQTLSGHNGPVHWAEFSPDGKWVASVGEDKTARVWSVEDGKLQQTLQEGRDPLLTVSFAPNSESFAASSEKAVFVWRRQ
jgi:WD40 repeat protein